jgi:thiol-disulfide isomerase/thioredoxin
LPQSRNDRRLEEVGKKVNVDFFSSNFCEPCMLTRAVLSQASSLVSGMNLVEHDVVREEGLAEEFAIRSTPTVVVRSDDGTEVFRAEGVPSINQVLVALAKAV